MEGLGWPADSRLRPALLRGAGDAPAAPPAPAAAARTAAEELQAQLATLQLARPRRSPNTPCSAIDCRDPGALLAGHAGAAGHPAAGTAPPEPEHTVHRSRLQKPRSPFGRACRRSWPPCRGTAWLEPEHAVQCIQVK